MKKARREVEREGRGGEVKEVKMEKGRGRGMRILEAVETEDAHSSEVSCRVFPLETNVLPLFRVSGLQLCARHQMVPEFLQCPLVLLQYTHSHCIGGCIY